MELDDVRDYIATNSGNHIVYIEYQYQQLGKDESWFNKVCALLNNNKLKIQREIFLKRIHGSSMSPYELEDLQAIEDLKGTIIEELFILKIFKLDIYTPLVKNRVYFIGVDVAGGYGEDNSAITIWDPYTMKTVAEFKSSNIGVKDLIKFLFILVRKYLPRSILAIERNHNGEAVLDHLRDTEIRGNIYFDDSKEPSSNIDEKLDAHGQVQNEAARRKFYGIWTGAKSRELMFGLLENFILEHKESFVGIHIINDLMKLVRTKSGKIEAQKGFHDDNIMSFLMCLYLYYYGNNLTRFGFTRGVVPGEEDRNKGMVYEDIYNALSDSERAALGMDDMSLADYQLNIKAQIENARSGLISHDELKEGLMEVPNNPTQPNKPQPQRQMQPMDPYQRRMLNEMMQAQRESETFNQKINFTNAYRNMDNEAEDYDPFDASLFAELNE